MAQPPTRNLLAIVFRNFIDSFKKTSYLQGKLVGQDHYGNKYFEIPANPSVGKRKANRWFQPKIKEDFQQEMPAEWEAWLRGRREQPPAEEEVMKNLAIINMKRKNAAAIDAKFQKPSDAAMITKEETGMASYPTYKEYETNPGHDKKPNQ